MSALNDMSFAEHQEYITSYIRKARRQYRDLFTHATLHEKIDCNIFQPKPKTNYKEKLWQIFSSLQKATLASLNETCMT
jgi:hypothetical protein